MRFSDIKSRLSLRDSIANKIKMLSTTFVDKETGVIDKEKIKYYEKLSNSISNCHNYIEIATCKDCGNKYLNKTMCCDFKFCPICSKKRYLKYLSFLYPIFENLVNQGKYICMLNLTIKNTTTFKEGKEKLFSAWREMTHENKFNAKLFSFHITGGLRSFEVTYNNEDKTYHAHFHILIVKEKFSKDFELIKTLWEQATQKVFNTNEKVGSIYIESIKDKRNRNISYMKDKSSILNGILECIKYVTKFNVKDENGNIKSIFEVYEDKQLIEMIDNFKNLRALSTFGCLYGYKKQLDDIKADESEEVIKKRVCKVCGCNEFYYEHEIINKIDKLLTFN